MSVPGKGRVAVGHPVDVSSGAQFTAAHDVELSGESALRFRRFYSTSLLEMPAGALGAGWTHEYEATLTRDLDGYRFFGHDGAEVCFDAADVLADGERVLRAGESMELLRAGDVLEVVHWHDLWTPVRRYVFARQGHGFTLVSILDPAGRGVALRRAADGRLARVVNHTDARALALGYDDAGRVAELRLELATEGLASQVIARYTYDAAGRLASVTDARGNAQRYRYDPGGRLVGEVSRGGAVWRMRYDDRGRCVEAVADGGVGGRRFRYFEGATEVLDSEGRSTLYELNDRGQVTREIRPDGSVLANRFDDEGRVVETVDPALGTTGWSYDDQGNVAEVRWPGGAVRRCAWNADHQPVGVEEPGGEAWRFSYHRGALTRIEEPGGVHREFLYDDHARLRQVVSRTGNRIDVSERGDMQERWYTDILGEFYRESRNLWLMPTTLSGPEGVTRRFEYDDDGHLIAEHDADGGTTRFTRDAEGNVVAVQEPDGAVWRTEFDAFGRCVLETDPLGRSHEYVYDAEGNLAQVRNPRGEVATFARDAAGRVVEVIHFDQRRERFSYDLGGRVLRHERSDGAAVTRDYDELGRLIAVRAGTSELARYRYDVAGRIVEAWSPDGAVQRSYDEEGFLREERQRDEVVRYTYDPCGGVATRDFSGARCGPLRFAWDLRARLTSITDGEGRGQRMRYDLADALVERSLGATRESRQHDAHGRVLQQHVAGVVSRAHTYDAQGRVSASRDSLRGERTWRYDAAGQLVEERSAVEARAWRHDLTGNVLQAGDTLLSYARGDVLTSVGPHRYVRDALGRVVQRATDDGVESLRWDPLDRLAAARLPDGREVRYGYDAFGRRLYADCEGERTEYFWSGDDLLSERRGGVVTDYAQSDGDTHLVWVDGAPLHVVSSPAAARPLEVIDDGGQLAWHGTYDAWGRLLREHGQYTSQRLRLPGQYADPETGLHYNRHRYYDPEAAQYLTPDPLRYPTGFNLYAYAPDPINWSDPLGLVCGKGAGKYSVYVLEDNSNPRRILYIGITEQHPSARASQHRNGGPSTPAKTFDRMRVVSNGLCYRQARNIEGSALRHATTNTAALNNIATTTVGGNAVPALLNSPRPTTPGYYHSYNNPAGGNRTLHQVGTINNTFTNNLGTY